MFHKDRMIKTKVVTLIYYYDCLKYDCYLLIAIKVSINFKTDFRNHDAMKCLTYYD